MKKIISICVILFTIFVPFAPVYCQDDSLVDDIKTVDGNVISVDVSNSQVTIKAYETMVFSVPLDANMINADGFNIQLSDVGVGNYVTVGYSDDKFGNHIMKSLEVDYNR